MTMIEWMVDSRTGQHIWRPGVRFDVTPEELHHMSEILSNALSGMSGSSISSSSIFPIFPT